MEFRKNDPAEARKYFAAKLAFTTGPVELSRQRDNSDIRIVDVRAAEDFAKSHIPNAVNLPKDRWDTLEGLERDKLNVLVCYSQVCHLAAAAGEKFASAGFSVMELEGGFRAWQELKLPVENGRASKNAA
jgi:rhodanese-related sulfurtransferase